MISREIALNVQLDPENENFSTLNHLRFFRLWIIYFALMSDVFPRWTNRLPLAAGTGLLVLGCLAIGGVWYYATPKYTRVGYQPLQPVPYSHYVHVTQVGLDCRYCHSTVEKSWYANVPSGSVCLNCHNQVLPNDPRLALVRDSVKSGQPIPWVQVHRTPDFVYFNHAVHVSRGVSCVHCHGQVNEMEEIRHDKPFSMLFCLECHRDPAPYLRPVAEVYNLAWTNDVNLQTAIGRKWIEDWHINASQNCSACHR
jgi:hypothetical protein